MPRKRGNEMPCYVTTQKPASLAEYKAWQDIGYSGSYAQYAESKSHAPAKIHLCGDLGPHCADCMDVGDNLCDYPVGAGKTCDRQICDTHAHEIAPNLHYCDAHHAAWREFVASGGVAEELRNVVAFKGA
jgi:hypothetical protein